MDREERWLQLVQQLSPSVSGIQSDEQRQTKPSGTTAVFFCEPEVQFSYYCREVNCSPSGDGTVAEIVDDRVTDPTLSIRQEDQNRRPVSMLRILLSCSKEQFVPFRRPMRFHGGLCGPKRRIEVGPTPCLFLDD